MDEEFEKKVPKTTELVDRYKDEGWTKEKLRILVSALETEISQQKIRIDILTRERNAVIEKAFGIRFADTLGGKPVKEQLKGES